MTTGFGIDPILDGSGNVTVGTSSDDIRRVTGSLYSPGLISGGVVTRSASALTYSISNGVAAFPIVVDAKTENKRTVLGPIPAATLTTTAPTSGSRVDMIYAQQLTPATDSDANIVVRVGTSLPARSVMLNAFIIGAGQTNTNVTTKTGDVAYSIPYGASMGDWANKRVTSIPTLNTSTKYKVITGSFFLPTDRKVNMFITAAMSASGAYRFSDTTYCEAGFELYIDNVFYDAWTTVGLHQAWAEQTFRDTYTLLQGTHTYHVNVYRAQTPGIPVLRDKGIEFVLQDVGPVV